MMLLETLSDYLSLYRITPKQACVLFGKSESTLRRWENNPPLWVLNILKMTDQRNTIPSSSDWSQFSFFNDSLYLPNGEKLSAGDILSLRFEQLNRTLIGDNPETIRRLKDHLEDQLKKQPMLKISLVDPSTETEVKNWSIAL